MRSEAKRESLLIILIIIHRKFKVRLAKLTRKYRCERKGIVDLQQQQLKHDIEISQMRIRLPTDPNVSKRNVSKMHSIEKEQKFDIINRTPTTTQTQPVKFTRCDSEQYIQSNKTKQA